MKKIKYWHGSVANCDICSREIKREFVDGKTVMGPWALMCRRCVGSYGVGLGLGRGQKYLDVGGRWAEVESLRASRLTELEENET
jgi:hypothetical protein